MVIPGHISGEVPARSIVASRLAGDTQAIVRFARFTSSVFHLLYVARELRRRLGRTVLTALGLALGVGLVIGIIGVSQGLDNAQNHVLAPLQSIGTDILVTRVVGAQPASTSANATSTTST